MFKVRETKDGGIAVIFSKDYRHAAQKLIPALTEQVIALPQVAGDSFENIVNRVESSLSPNRVVNGEPIVLTLSDKYKRTPSVPTVSGLQDEKTSNEIVATAYDSMIEQLGSAIPVRLRTLYTSLERECGKQLTKIHKHRTDGKDVRKYPNRKIDSILTVLDPDYVLDFVKRYEFTY